MTTLDQIAACDRMQERMEQRREIDDWAKRDNAWLREQAERMVAEYEEILSEVA